MHFLSSVIRLGVLQDGAEREFWGTGFLVNQNRLVTAHHCLPKASTVTIDGWIPDEAPLASIKTFGTIDPVRPAFLTRSRVGLAILQFQADPFPTAPKFKLWQASVLDDCLVMGYPQMMGFAPELIAGTGQIVGQHMSTARNQSLVLVDARMKGGNSGGPVLNRLGKVLGVVCNALTNEEQNFDQLGYGLATPAQTGGILLRPAMTILMKFTKYHLLWRTARLEFLTDRRMEFQINSKHSPAGHPRSFSPLQQPMNSLDRVQVRMHKQTALPCPRQKGNTLSKFGFEALYSNRRAETNNGE